MIILHHIMICHMSPIVDSHSPVADPPVLDTVTVISVDDGLLRTSTGCAGPSDSLILYTD